MQSKVKDEVAESLRRRVPGCLRLVISAMLLAALVMYVDLTESWRIVRNANLALIVVLVVLFFALRFLSAYRWYILLHGKNPAITFRKVIRLTFTSLFIGTFMPGGTDLVRIYLLSRTTSDLALAFSSMLVERVLALLALFALVLFGLLATPSGLPSMIGYAAWLGLMLLGLGCLTFMHPKFRGVTNHLLTGQFFTPVRIRLAKVYNRLDAYSMQPWLIVWSFVLAFSLQILRVGCTVIGAWGLGIQLPLMTFVVIVPIIFLIALIPISIGGLGVREAAFVSLLGLVEVKAEAAFTLSLLLYVISILTTLPGAFFYATERSTNP